MLKLLIICPVDSMTDLRNTSRSQCRAGEIMGSRTVLNCKQPGVPILIIKAYLNQSVVEAVKLHSISLYTLVPIGTGVSSHQLLP